MQKNLLFLWLAILLASCQVVEDQKIISYFKDVPPKTEFIAGRVARPIQLGSLPGATLALLPVKSIMGGGMGEEVVTTKFYEKLSGKFKQLKIISDKEASKLFTDIDLWDDYYESLLTDYYQAKTVQVDKLIEIYRHLKPDYLVGITADYNFARPTPPRSFSCFIYVQIWDAKDGRLVWDGQAQGSDTSEKMEGDSEIVETVVKYVCQEIIGHM